VKGVSVLEGIKNKLGADVKVTYAKGCEIVDERWPESEILPEPLTKTEKDGIDKAVEAAKDADVAIIVLGDQARTVGEFASRSSLDLPGRQLDLLRAVHAAGKPVILIVINGRPISINWAQRNVPGILEAAFPGAHGGTAIADALFGDYNPGGKLSMTWPKTVGQLPYNFPTKPNAQAEGERTRVPGALYYFGHGLSYTTFAYSNLKITPATPRVNGNVTVTVEVQNTGTRAGDEVVQLYTNDKVSSVTTYEKNLRGFERVNLQPGEKKTVTFTLVPADLALLNKTMRFTVEPGVFKVMIGSSSEDIRLTGEFESVP
jgi:beta-glucosidase